ncbi:type VII secretion protein EssC [Neobacillus sp. LXY-4]|uniref:type VII secretion protein EssC n=1 Tax=Neobacillus sp. LXY-4 TaxID=3379826 RepID=UPI003EE31CAF
MILTLFDEGKVFRTVLPERVTGRYILSSEDEDGHQIDLMAVEEENGHWYLKSNKYAFLKNPTSSQIVKEAKVEVFQTYTIYRENRPTTALLYVEPPTADGNIFTKHEAARGVIKIGRAKDSHICFTNKLVSSSHCTIEYLSGGRAVIRDHNSSNGTYVNGKKVIEKELSIGDTIFIMGLKIIYNGRLLSLNNPHRSVFLDRTAFTPFSVEKPIIQEEELLDELHHEEINDNLFFRSPRFKRDIQRAEIKIDPPPQPQNMEETPLMLLLGPSITMGMSSLFMGIMTFQNVMSTGGDLMRAMPTLVMSVSMLIGTILWPILTKRYEKRKKLKLEKMRHEKYQQYLADMNEVVKNECRNQREILLENHVTLENCLSRIMRRQRNLWERGPGQADFLEVRLGIGDLPMVGDIKLPERKFTLEDDHLQETLYEMFGAKPVLESVPVTLSLIEERINGIIGDRKEVKSFVKGLIFQLTALHSYDELKLVFIYDKNELDDWKFVKWLPHVWNDDKTVRFIASDANEVKELSAFFEKVISQRQEQGEFAQADAGPHYIVFSMSKALAPKAEMINLLLQEKHEIGFSIIALYDELKNLPKECSNVIELSKEYSKIYDKDDISGQYTGFNADSYLEEDPEQLAVKLSNIQLDSSQGAYKLPEMMTFLEMFGVGKIEHLNALTRWKENNPTKTIETPIGVDTAGEPFMIDLHEKYHGPHGLIAGMTGSGKSEFIMTFILSLAVNYHPDEVAFILIDYKGGGMANAFTELPHLAGTITNLDGAAVKRSLISIQSELKRRQEIFSETSRRMDESNIDIYKYQKLYREGHVTEPLQHLFIISDEFAELKAQQPEFMEQLVSAARIGRSLGIHLILATQKPSGVVDDQIWSNSKFRISLKVQEKADSMEVIKRPDAAELQVTGRFYLQVGFNELFMLGQSAWAGAPYYPADKVEKQKDDSVVVIDNLGRVIKNAKMDRKKTVVKNPPKQIDEVTDYLAKLASQENINVRPLWLEPIPEFIYIDELIAKYKVETPSNELDPVIGEYDDPANQRQMVMTMPITREGNAVIYGVAGSGKTTFLSTLIYSLMEQHTPKEVNFYLMDFSSETLTWFREAPHVGEVMLSHESEKIGNLFKMLSAEVEHRKKLLANYGGDFITYNGVSGDRLPSLIVVIHNYSAFSEMYEDHEETLAFLTREGVKYGVYFIVTAINTGALRYRMLQNFKQMYVLQLNDQSEYSGLLGSVDGVYPSKFKGRGIFKSDLTYEFQTAQIARDVDNMFKFITDYCPVWANNWTLPGAKKVPTLPEKVDLDYLRGERLELGGHLIPVGVEKETMEVAFFDLVNPFISLVAAMSSEQCSSFTQGIAELFATKEDREILVLDPNQNFVNGSLVTDYKYVFEPTRLEEAVVYLFNTLVHRNNTKKDAIEAGQEPPTYDNITCIIDSFTDLHSFLSEDARDKLKVFLEKGSGLNVHLLLSDRADKLSSISFEAWFKQHVSVNDFIWVGSGITDQYVLKTTKVTGDMYKEVPSGFGYVVTKGKPVLVKLLSATAGVEKEAVYHG